LEVKGDLGKQTWVLVTKATSNPTKVSKVKPSSD
jgi:hypothetical protein